MEVLLINPPLTRDEFPPNLPVGIAYIASALMLDGHNVSILDIKACRYTERDVIGKIKQSKADLIGVGGLITTYNYQKWLIEKIREFKGGIPIVAGGGLVTSLPKLVFDKMDVDYGVISEGEIIIRRLCKAIETEDDVGTIDGICYKDNNGKLCQTNAAPLVEDLDNLPLPAWDLLPMDVYTMNGVIDVLSSRGCPMHCTFCYHLFGRGKYRLRSSQNLMDEIYEIRKRWPNVSHVHFLDDNMMVNNKRLFEFCDLMQKTGLTWDVHGRVTSINKEALEKMKKGGCARIGFGIESGSQKILNQMKKRVTAKQALNAVRLTHKMGIKTHETYIIGYPAENRETVNETVKFSKKIFKPVRFFYATPYPGTELFEKALSLGKIPKPDDLDYFVSKLGDATEFLVNLTSYDNETLIKWKHEAEEETKKWTNKFYVRYLRLFENNSPRQLIKLLISSCCGKERG